MFTDKSPISPGCMQSCLKIIIREAGFDASLYSAHSLRIGRTCNLFKLGLSVETIKNTPALYDVWVLGDNFVKELFPAFEAIKFKSQHDSKTTATYMQEYYNLRAFNNLLSGGVKLAVVRVVNSLIEGINRKDIHHLPKLLIVVIDKDLINDLDLHDENIVNTIQNLTQWLVRQIDMTIRWKRMDLLEKRPGAARHSTKIIFVRMLRCIGSFHPNSKMSKICDLRSRFNDALNSAVAKINQFMLTINNCNTYDHFDRLGNLSPKGKKEFWYELDDLIDRFDCDKVKLLPTPKVMSKVRKTMGFQSAHQHQRHVGAHDFQHRRKLPTPPPPRNDHNSSGYDRSFHGHTYDSYRTSGYRY